MVRGRRALIAFSDGLRVFFCLYTYPSQSMALMRALPDADLYHGGWVNSSSSSDPPLGGGRSEDIKREEGKVAVRETLEGKVQVQQDLSSVKESQKQLDPKLQPTPLYQLYPSLCGDRIVQERSDMRRFQAFKDFPGRSPS